MGYLGPLGNPNQLDRYGSQIHEQCRSSLAKFGPYNRDLVMAVIRLGALESYGEIESALAAISWCGELAGDVEARFHTCCQG
jgi:hypothetical protein